MKEQILSFLPPDFSWGQNLHYFDCIESTNTLAKTMAAQGAPHGTILIADRQTGGRGRLGRSFHSPGGTGIYMSVILRPQCAPQDLMHLTCASGLALCDAVEKCAGIRACVKWPNDLVVEKKKLAGILTELGLDAATGSVSYAIVGIGINCCQSAEDFPPEIRDIATSVSMVTHRSVSRPQLAAAMLEELYKMDQILLSEKKDLMKRYRKDCLTLGKTISVIQNDVTRRGKAVDIDDDGALLVEFSPGNVEIVNSGEVSVRGLYGYL